MGNLCCFIDENYENDNYTRSYINKDYIKIHNDKLKHILINTYIDKKIWVLVTSHDYEKYKNNSDEIVSAISIQDNEILNIRKGDIISIALNIDLAPDLFLQK